MGQIVVQVGNAAQQREFVKKRTELLAPQITSAFGMTVKQCMECTSVVEHSGQKDGEKRYEPWLKP